MNDAARAGARHPIVIDTDGGVDDAFALYWAATAPDVDLLAVTVVHGNLHVEGAAANVCRVLAAAGRADVPVYVGEETAMGPVPPLRPADFIHGSDGLGDTHRPAAPFGPRTDRSVDDVFRSIPDEHPGAVSLVTIGPMTNVGQALRRGALLPERWHRLVAMGGTIEVQGNALPMAEANIAHDPVAAATALGAGWSQPPLLVGLDVTHRATLTTAEVAVLEARRGRAADFLAEPFAFYRRAGGTFCAPGEWPCHDLLAVMAAVQPLVHGPVLPLAVQTEPGPAWAATVADRRQPFFTRAGGGSAQAALPGFQPCELGLEVDVEWFRAALRRFLAAD